MEPLQGSDPRFIAGYRLDFRLASGGMGIVFLGLSPGGRQVAVKLIRPEFAQDPEFRERFRREVGASRAIGGFHTAAVVDADPDADLPWMVTQYIAGPSLHDQVRQHGPLDEAAVLGLAAALAEGLRAIHAAGLVHRDLTPRNVIMAADGPRIIDFGIAKPAGTSADPGLTATGKVIGTPAYMSPEHFDDRPVSPASDIFALGSVLVFAATGRPPFGGGSLSATGYAIINKAPDLRALPAGLAEIAAACLAKPPGARPATEALLALLSRTVPSPGRTSSFGGGRSGAAATAGAAGPLPDGRFPRGELDQATVTRPSQMRPVPVPPVPGQLAQPRRAPLPRVPVPDPRPPQPQVWPARQGWWLVTASVDGRWVAAANGDGIISAWLAGPGEPVRSWAAGARARAMVAGPDDLLIVAGDDGQVRAWDVGAGTACAYLPRHVPALAGPGVWVQALALDRTGAWLAVSTPGKITVWDVADPREPAPIAELPSAAEVTALAFDDTGWLLATGDSDGKVHVWDLREPWDTAQVDPPDMLPEMTSSGTVLALAWDEARHRWLGAGADGPLGPAGPAHDIALSPAGGFAAVIDDARRRVHLVPSGDPGRFRTLDGNNLVITAVAVAGGGIVAIGDSQGALRLWDAGRPAMRTIRADGSPITALATSPDGTRLAATDKSPAMSSYHVPSGSLDKRWAAPFPESTGAVAFSPDGKRLLTAAEEVSAWNADNGKARGALPAPTAALGADRVRAIAHDHAGQRVAAAWSSGLVCVWDGSKPLCELAGHKGAAIAVAFGPRPGQLVTAGDDETIRTWDLGTGQQVACHCAVGYRVTVLAARPARAAPHPGDVTIAAGCADGTVRLPGRSEPTGRPDWASARVLAGHAHGITAMSFDPAGQWLATGGRDGTVRLWDLPGGSVVTVLAHLDVTRDDAARAGLTGSGSGPGGAAGWAAAVASPDGGWHGLGATEGRIWQAAGLRRIALPGSPAPRQSSPPFPLPSPFLLPPAVLPPPSPRPVRRQPRD
jgi:WD40 repeat protein